MTHWSGARQMAASQVWSQPASLQSTVPAIFDRQLVLSRLHWPSQFWTHSWLSLHSLQASSSEPHDCTESARTTKNREAKARRDDNTNQSLRMPLHITDAAATARQRKSPGP